MPPFKLYETNFEMIWETFKETLKAKGYEDFEYKSHLKYSFWVKLVFTSKYIDDVRFVKRKSSP